MKKIFQLAVVLMAFVPAICFGQSDKKVWAELKTFHLLMSASYHPVEESNYAPLRTNAEQLYRAAKRWQQSEIPSNYRTAETKAALKNLHIKCAALYKAVAANKTDAELKMLITEAHDIFHNIEGECRRAD